MKRQKNRIWPILILIGIAYAIVPNSVYAQKGIGVRFGTNFNKFFRSEEFDVSDGWWSTAGIGVFYQAYFKHGGFRAGVNVQGKPSGRGLPVVMQNFSKNINIGMGAVEADLRVGPRFAFFNPQIGYIMGVYFGQSGFLEPGSSQGLVPLYIALPFGANFEFPTGYGSVGFGFHYMVGLTNVLKDPTPGDGQPYDGSKLRYINFEINTVFMAGKQERKKPPPPKPFEEE